MAAANTSTDMAALAALRPGMPTAAVKAAMGASWRQPAAHKGGVIDSLENTSGVVVRLDRHGRIGTINFNARFKGTVAGIPMGVEFTDEDLRAIAPAMQIGEKSKTRPKTRYGTMQLPEGQLTARISFDAVYEITISNPKAEYEDAFAPPYPPASGAPGAPFADPNLKLAVMSALLRLKMLDLGTPDQLASHVLGRPVDLEEEGYELIRPALDYLVRYPLSAEQLAAVDWIQFDGGEAIYPYAWYFWDGEGDVFDIRDTSDLHLCVNLEGISVIAMTERFDLRTLVKLPKLEWIKIYVPDENLEALLDVPSLKRASRFPRTPANQSILERLEQNGVKVN